MRCDQGCHVTSKIVSGSQRVYKQERCAYMALVLSWVGSGAREGSRTRNGKSGSRLELRDRIGGLHANMRALSVKPAMQTGHAG